MLQTLIPIAQVYTDLHSFLDLISLIRVHLRHLRLEIESKISYAKQACPALGHELGPNGASSTMLMVNSAEWANFRQNECKCLCEKGL